jgi:hypothetical protein
MATQKRTVRKSSKSKGNSVDLNMAGHWAFLAGLILSVVLSLMLAIPQIASAVIIPDWAFSVLALLALFGGYIFIPKDGELHFIVLAIGIAVFASSIGGFINPTIGGILASIFGNLGYYLGFAVVAVAARNVVAWLRDGFSTR